MTLDTRAFGLAAGAVAAALFTLCATAVAIAPDWTMSVSSTLLHVDLSGLASDISSTGYLVGLVAWGTATAGTVSVAASLYNRWAADRPVGADASSRADHSR